LRKKSRIPEGRTEAAKQTKVRFLENYAALSERFKTIALSVLVWGPNPKSVSAVGKKRREIKEELLINGHVAMFSEDQAKEDPYMSQKTHELIQGQASDVIIVLLEDSPGALGELHDFASYPDLAPKLLVLVPNKYRRGYSAEGILQDLVGYGRVYWYKPGELESCNVLKTAVQHVEAIRNHRFCQ